MARPPLALLLVVILAIAGCVQEPPIEPNPDRMEFEEGACFFNGHIQHLGDGAIFEAHLQGVGVIAFSFADFADHEYIGQEVHGDFPDALTTARFAATALHVE